MEDSEDAVDVEVEDSVEAAEEEEVALEADGVDSREQTT